MLHHVHGTFGTTTQLTIAMINGDKFSLMCINYEVGGYQVATVLMPEY